MRSSEGSSARNARKGIALSGLDTCRVGWLCRHLDDVPSDDEWLTDAERSTLSGLTVPKRRGDWRLGRWTAKVAVERHLVETVGEAVPAVSLEIRAADDGAPEAWRAGHRAPVSISITHRAGRSVVAVTDPHVALGCDLELVEPRRQRFVEDFFTPAEVVAANEVAALSAQSPVAASRDSDELVTRLWAVKEAALKALREGLRVDTKRLQVVPVVPDADGEALLDGGRQVAMTCDDQWMGLSVRVALEKERVLEGWWCRFDGAVLAVVADPRPAVPHRLER